LRHNPRRRSFHEARFAVLVCFIWTVSLLALASCEKPLPDTSTSPIGASPIEPGSDVSMSVLPTEIPPDKVPGTPPQIVPVPSRGAMTGQIVSASTSRPLTGTVVRLARVFWNEQHTDGAFVLESASSPSTATNDEGFFAFEDLDPADYTLIIGEVPGDHVIVSKPDGSAEIFTVEKDKVTDVGQIPADLLGGNR
jgi:hypothetical protein